MDNAENLDIIMSMYNWLEYSENGSSTSRSPHQFKRDEQNINDNGNLADVRDSSPSLKYKSSISGNTAADGILKNTKIVVPLKCLSNSFRSLEMPLINCKIQLLWS